MSTGIKRDFEHAIAEKMTQKATFLADGGAENFPRYQYIAGEYKGLKVALTVFQEVYDKYLSVDEEEDEEDDD